MKISKQRLKEIIREELKKVQESTVQVSRDVDADFRGNMVQLIGRKGKVPLSKKDLLALIRLVQKHMGRAYTEDVNEAGFADKFMKTVDKHNDKLAQNALHLVRQQIMKKYKVGKPSPVEKSTKVTRRLVATLINNGMKEIRNKTKSPELKKALQKIIDIREKHLKTMKEGKLTEGKKIKLPSGVTIEIGIGGLKIYDHSGNPIPFDRKDVLKFLRASRQQLRIA